MMVYLFVVLIATSFVLFRRSRFVLTCFTESPVSEDNSRMVVTNVPLGISMPFQWLSS